MGVSKGIDVSRLVSFQGVEQLNEGFNSSDPLKLPTV